MTAEQENLLRRHYAGTRTDRLAAALGVSYRTVCRWAASLGLEKNEDFRQGFSAINGSMERDWSHRPKGEGAKLSAEVTEYLRQHYATTDNRVLAARFNVNDRTIRRWADRLALRKDSDWVRMHRVAHRNMTPEQRFQLVATIRELYPDGLHDEELVRRTGYSFKYILILAPSIWYPTLRRVHPSPTTKDRRNPETAGRRRKTETRKDTSAGSRSATRVCHHRQRRVGS